MSEHGGSREGAGRPKGSKKTTPPDELIEKYRMTKGDPTEFLFELANDENADLADRRDAAKALLPYLNKKKPVQADVTSNGKTLIWSFE